MNFATGAVEWQEVFGELTKESPQARAYALLDGAQVYHSDFFKANHHKSDRFISLLGHHVGAGAPLAGPILIELSKNEDLRLATSLISFLQHQNPVSFLSSLVELEPLVRHLTWLIDVMHDDETEWVMRYFDPRVLPHWIEVLSPEQMREALSPIYRWIYMGVDGEANVIVGNGPFSPRGRPMMKFTSSQHEQLMDQSLPYTILNSMEEDGITSLLRMTYAENVQKIQRLVCQARSFGLHSFIDIKTFCVLAHDATPTFVDIPEVRLALSAGSAGRFHEHALAWGEEVWNKVQRAS